MTLIVDAFFGIFAIALVIVSDRQARLEEDGRRLKIEEPKPHAGRTPQSSLRRSEGIGSVWLEVF